MTISPRADPEEDTARGHVPPTPFSVGHERLRYSNRAVSNSNKAVAVFIRQFSLSVKL